MRDIYIRTITGYKSITFKKILILLYLAVNDVKEIEMPQHESELFFG